MTNSFEVVKEILKKKNRVLLFCKKYTTPFYLFDREAFQKGLESFTNTFQRYIPRSSFFYAMKSNPHDYLLEEVAKGGHGFDVSSGQELQQALTHKPSRIIFTGPGKSIKELEFAVKHHKKVIVNIDSVREVEKLIPIAKKHKKSMEVGIRVNIKSQKYWNKFGLELDKLADVWKKCKSSPYLQPKGIQIHMSWNKDSSPYKRAIKELSSYLAKNSFIKETLSFIDLGGGFLPHELLTIFTQGKKGIKRQNLPTVPIEIYAKEIGLAIHKYFKDLDIEYFFEPGRIVSTYAFHIVLKVEDVKRPGMVITDGGTNMIGWTEEYYNPIVNLTHPSLKEMECHIYGSLCTPEDYWGHFVYAKEVKEGDILVIPYQGAYTYTHAQAFIKEFPRVYPLY